MTSIARYSLNRFEYSGPDDFSSETSVDSGSAVAALVADVEEAEIRRIRPVLRLGLEEDAPDAPEAVELVHVGAAEERLERRVHVLDRDAELEHPVLVDAREELRHGGRVRRRQERDLGPLLQLGHEPLRVLPEVVDGVAGAILDEHVDAAGLADAGDGGREEREHLRVGQPVELPVHGGDDRVRLELPRRPLVVRCRAGRSRRRCAGSPSARGGCTRTPR